MTAWEKFYLKLMFNGGHMKKVLSILCALIIVAGAFAGCSQKTAQQAGFELKFAFDSHYSKIGSESVEVYEQLCQAVLDGESSVTVNNDFYDDASRLFYVSFPFSKLVKGMNLNSDGSIRITYTETESQHKKLVTEFTDKVYSVLSDCGYPDADNNELLLNIYSYVSQNIKQNLDYSTAYDALVVGEGSSSAYEAMFRYLVQQAGFSASRVYGVAYDGAHFMTEIILDGEHYYFDPYSENVFSKGKGLSYFGIGSIGLQQMGLGSEVSYSDNQPIDFGKDSGKFDELYQTVSYEYKSGVITATKKSGTVVEVAL